MSGRKSSEVAQVLASSQKGRERTVADARKALDDAATVSENSGAKLDQLQEDGKLLAAKASEDALRYFPESAKQLAARLKDSLEKLNQAGGCHLGVARLRNSFQELGAKLAAADNEAASIRSAIAAKRNGWYCDAEYAQAQKLGRTYQNLFSGYAKILNDCSAVKAGCLAEENAARIQLDLARRFNQDLLDLNDTARKREESNALREQLQKLYAGIDPGFANKFYEAEYAALSRELDSAAAWKDEEVLAAYGALAGRLEGFSMRLAERVTQWQEEKAAAELGLASLRDLAAISFIGPIEFFNRGEAGRQEALFDFLEHYAGASPRKEYEELAHSVEQALAREDFAECRRMLASGVTLLEDARVRALKLRENMLNKTYLAAELQKAMNTLGYNTSLGFFDDDNPNTGFRLDCYIGDENIDFEHIDINDDGSIALQINHKSVGACGPSWTKIAGRLCEMGIPVTDVRMADGVSVLYGQQSRQGPVAKPEQTHRRG